MIRKHYRLEVKFHYEHYIEYEPDEIPEGTDPFDTYMDPEYIHDFLQCALDDGDYTYDIIPISALDEN